MKGIQDISIKLSEGVPQEVSFTGERDMFGNYEPARLSGTVPVDKPTAHVVPAVVSNKQSPGRKNVKSTNMINYV